MSEIIRTAEPVSADIVELARRVAWAGHKFDVDGKWDLREKIGLVAQVKRLGAGHFSRVYNLPGHDALVVKVGGRAAYGYGQSRPGLCGLTDHDGLPAVDQWPTYLQVVAEEFAGEPWVPRVHHFEKLRSVGGSLYFAVMERLEPACDYACPRSIRTLLGYKADEHGVRMDLHEDNYMLRPGTEQIVITDPWSRAEY